ncbi:MAG TPA: hypothetical protein VIY29_12490, partial [Ktedonobacteraceae bacterium]
TFAPLPYAFNAIANGFILGLPSLFWILILMAIVAACAGLRSAKEAAGAFPKAMTSRSGLAPLPIGRYPSPCGSHQARTMVMPDAR